MRRLDDPRLSKYALDLSPGDPPVDGAFKVRNLTVIASCGLGWDHVSVSMRDRCPTWKEMELVKHLFFLPEETAMQLHVPRTDHINIHPFVLHLWRPQHVSIPRPPEELV